MLCTAKPIYVCVMFMYTNLTLLSSVCPRGPKPFILNWLNHTPINHGTKTKIKLIRVSDTVSLVWWFNLNSHAIRLHNTQLLTSTTMDRRSMHIHTFPVSTLNSQSQLSYTLPICTCSVSNYCKLWNIENIYKNAFLVPVYILCRERDGEKHYLFIYFKLMSISSPNLIPHPVSSLSLSF